jgi:DNA polymerase-3 subunit delta
VALIGPELFVRREVKNSLIKRALGASLKEMNFSQFQVGEDEIARAMDACRDYPCFSEKRVVVLCDVGKIKKKESEELIAYLKNPVPSTLLILEDEKIDGRLEWAKLLKKQAEYVEIPEADVSESLQWVRQCFQQEGKKVSGEVLDRLVAWVGNSLGALQLTVNQLCLYVGDKPEVTMRDIETLLIKVADENIFVVIDCLFAGRLVELHRSLDALLEGGEAPLKILGLVYRHLSILLALKFSDESRVGSLFRLHPMIRKQYERQAQKYNRQLTLSLLAPIAEADIRLKGSNLPNDLLLKHAVEEIISLLAKR